jgi:hypothetical protein
MIALKKKPKATKCSYHHTYARISARARRRRIEKKIEGVLGEDQLGFGTGKGTTYAVGMLRITAERTVDIA